MRPKTRIDLKKGAIVRCLKQFWRPGDVLLYEDETIIRLFPPLRACWALREAKAAVPNSTVCHWEAGYCWRFQSQPHKLFKFGRIKRISSLFCEFANSIPVPEGTLLILNF